MSDNQKMSPKQSYELACARRMDAGLPQQSYEEYLEGRLTDVGRMLSALQREVACYLDAIVNEQHYRSEIGLGDDEINAMQSRTRGELAKAIEQYGWEINPHEDGGYTIVNSLTGVRIYCGVTSRVDPTPQTEDKLFRGQEHPYHNYLR